MNHLRGEARLYAAGKRALVEEAAQDVAFFLAVGIDLAEALAATGRRRERTMLRLRRVLERERLKGARRHWSYDLNRHIALKQALDRFRNACR